MRLHFSLAFLLVCSGLPNRAQAQLVLSEFLASNATGLRDDLENREDWIEISNPSAGTVSLAGWYLTDDSSRLRKWPMPAWTLGAGRRMIVFASNRDRRPSQAVPGQDNTGTASQPRLATNFKISNNAGKYLALTKDTIVPGGVEVVSAFIYPRQLPDVGYGLQDGSAGIQLVAANSNAKALVPTVANGGNTLGSAWRGGAEPFDDSAWTAGTQGAGIAGGVSPVEADQLKFRLSADSADSLVNDGSGAGHDAVNVSNTTLFMPSATDTAPNPVLRRGALQFVASNASQLTVAPHADFDTPAGTIMFWMKSAGMAGGGSEAALLFRRRSGSGTLLALTESTSANPGRIFCQPVGGGASFYSTARVDDDQWHHVAFVYQQAAGGTDRFYIDGVESGSATHASAWSWPVGEQILWGKSNSTYWYKYNGLLDEVRFYGGPLTPEQIARIYQGADESVDGEDVGLDLGATLPGNPGVFLRVPFTVTDPAAIQGLRLTARCGDGFTAYLNGIQIASSNDLPPPAWDAIATATALPTRSQVFAIGSPGLVAGTNILAVHAHKQTIDDPNFLSLNTLDAITSDPTGRYLQTPTPGATNSAALENLGPIVTEVRYNGTLELPPQPTGGGGSPDLTVSAKVTASLRPLAGTNPVQLAWRIMYGAETLVPMSAGAGGIYSATIPTTGLGAGQMLRWRIIASDNTGIQGTAPAYFNPTASDEYFGTVALDGITTALPVYHVFVPGIYQSNNSHVIDQNNVGGRASFFYDGELYDNVFIRIKGDTTRTMNKRSHRVDFNPEHQFRYAPGRKLLRELALNAEYVDPSYSRQMTSMALHRATGTGAQEHYPVRCQINGVFWQLAFHTETADAELLENIGLDPNGALYVSVGQMSGAAGEKQTRLGESNADMSAFVTAITASDPAVRKRNVFDQIDIPAVVNYLAVARITHEADDVWANMTIHRDSNHTREWRIIPFDTNLSFGQLYYGDYPAENGFIQATSDYSKSHPLYGNKSCAPIYYSTTSYNRFYDAIISVPETRAMLLRRMRSIMDAQLQPPGTAAPLLEQALDAHAARIAPEAALDRAQWGWPPIGGPYGLGNDSLATAISEIKSDFLTPRRAHLFNTHTSTNNVGIGNFNSAGIPASPQPAAFPMDIAGYDANPAGSTTQDEEFIELVNPNAFAADLTGWTLGGGVRFAFASGTVVPAGGSIFISPRQAAFRTRAVSPTGGEGRFVVGPYDGQLSARGELVEVRDAANLVVSSLTIPAAPTPAQLALRISELNYHPAGPTLAETAVIGSLVDDDFEFIELLNTGATTLDLGGARFTKGVDFTFAAGTMLASGARLLVVANPAAFQLRYGTGITAVGPFLGSLDNGGEDLKIVDPSGEVVLDFSYDDAWFPPTDGDGYTLVVRDPDPSHSGYGQPIHWAIGGTPGGTPGNADDDFAQTYAGWRWDHFTPDEVVLPNGSENTAVAGVLADPDQDGFDNFHEYAFGLNPRAAQGGSTIAIGRVTLGADTYDTFTFNRRRHALDLDYAVQFSADLMSWSSITVPFGDPVELEGGMERVTYRDTLPSSSTRRFARVLATMR